MLYTPREEGDMSIPWPSERVSGIGLAEFLGGAVSLLVGVAALRRAGLAYLSPAASNWRPLAVGSVALCLCGVLLYRLVRRREYPWIVAAAAVALPLFQPSQAPYGPADRAIFALRDLALLGLVVFFVVRTMSRADELEQRIHLRAVGLSYTAVLVALIGYTLAEDALPPLRGAWVASGMLGSWVAAWLFTCVRYQR
jgi:hypothetical protein